ncbi:MAG: hypothetical protein U0838_03570 [Chloroflexota bacterium]
MLVMNGDLVTSFDIGDLLDVYRSSGAVATVGVRRYLHTVPSAARAERDGIRITRTRGEAHARARGQRGHLRPDARLRRERARWPRLAARALDAAMDRGELVAAHEVEGEDRRGPARPARAREGHA